MSDVIIFHLAKQLPPIERSVFYKRGTIYEEIKAGRKTSEWRDMTHYWVKRLFSRAKFEINANYDQDLTPFLKVHKAWFVQGYPKGNLPRLEADIIGAIFHTSFHRQQLEIKFTNVNEVKE